MGNITGAMVFQSTIPTVVALVFASSTWVVGPGLVHRLRVGRDRVPVVGRASSSRWPARGGLRGRGLLVGGVFYLVYLAPRRRGRQPASSAEPAAGRSGAADILGRPRSKEPARDADREVRRRRHRRPTVAPRPDAAARSTT